MFLDIDSIYIIALQLLYTSQVVGMFDSIISHLKKSKTENSDVFCTQLSVPSKGLSLNIDSIGVVEFPVSVKMAKGLIVEAEPAKYGSKDKTLLDRKVRDTWEISKNHIQTNKEWDLQMDQALQKIQRNLNLAEDGMLSAELHNLLIYMPGQFFKSHQDSEKAEGMLATLIILLPSEFTGGEFAVDQHGDQRVFDFSKESKNDLIFTAFYTDCYHEVKEVKSGYRLALTYNLFFKSNTKQIVTKKNVELEKTVQEYFARPSENAQSNNPLCPQWFVYLLDHEYTRSSLDWFHLRGLDRDRVAELLACADQLGLTAHLALADVHETWSTEDDNWSGRYGRRRWSHVDQDEESIPSSYRLTELIEDEIILRHWIARSGQKFKDRDKYVPKQIVCWTKAVDQFKPFESNYEGYMGNYGNTLDRWYHRAAIVLWKNDSDLISLFICDKIEALKSISEILKKNLKEGQRILQQVIPYWPEHIDQFLDPAVVLKFAKLIQDQDLALKLVKTVGITSLRAKNLTLIVQLIESYDEDWFIQILNFWRESPSRNDEPDFVFKELVTLVDGFASQYKKVNHWLLQDQLSILIHDDAITERLGRRWARETKSKSMKVVEELLKVSHFSGEISIHDKIIDHVLNRPKLYDEIELANLFDKLGGSIYATTLFQLADRLQKQVLAPRKDGDWSIRDKISHSCSDCQYLENFLVSTSAQKMVWPLAQGRRAHIHQIIETMDISVIHETIHEGSPHKLVLIKTLDLFKKEKARAKSIESCLERLLKTKDDRIGK
jgi:hypothetical protein